ncbi:NAD(P)/FAD-dependent oxidoreductase [Salinicola rhizosphaerae]|uniref:FAD-dependent oxidoreductase n=1 Tax=Salinicola rhizosphaerae TaxID=1443141 RepID=A0ABQ3DUJ9_9GAMM|nr:NAD(P)/FAD-dependent oxidoreductase [Salinicola rhizosphaerae]GHB16140.1 FAD-dependent oxidoreductase [Salinicola rhizosphaerae]
MAETKDLETAGVHDHDVIVIGAGPSGATAAARLAAEGHDVLVIERAHFPRFSIGESLLPQCMQHLEEAGLLETVLAADYQPKNGAAFTRGGVETAIDFREKFTPGWGTTFQVERADFDQRLIDAARQKGAEVMFGAQVTAFHADSQRPAVELRTEDGESHRLGARFVLDASGYGRVLARLEGLERDPRQDSRCALFTHVQTAFSAPDHDREKILIGVHADDPGIWYWLIPFRDGRASVGVVGDAARLDALAADAGPMAGEEDRQGDDDSARLEQRWRALIATEPRFRELLQGADLLRPVAELRGYSADVTRLTGPGYALLGNAGEFLDPVFSSGVTIALRSASLAVPLVERTLDGTEVDWANEFETPLREGIDTFRAFVDAWYDASLQTIIFHEDAPAELKARISAVLAGYAWDRSNPFVKAPRKHLDTLAALCRLRAGATPTIEEAP